MLMKAQMEAAASSPRRDFRKREAASPLRIPMPHMSSPRRDFRKREAGYYAPVAATNSMRSPRRDFRKREAD